MKGYKFIKKDMKSQHGNHKWELNKWYKEEDIKICDKGFHACKTPLDSLEYVYGDRWFIVEVRGKIIKEGDKFVSQEMRLIKELPIDKIVKPFAIWCANQCLKNYEKEYPDDKRVYSAIEGAELYLDGKIDLKELNKRISATESARSAGSARSAARSAAESAARSAAGSARSAAESAWYAARYAAESVSKKNQNKKLKELIKQNIK